MKITDRELKLNKHVKYICKKADNKLNALARMANIFNPFQKNTLLKSFIKDQFNYCSLLLMFSSGSTNLIDKIIERALSFTSEINYIPFNVLLSINNEVSIYDKNIKARLTEAYKNLHGLSTSITLGLFMKKDSSVIGINTT